MSRRQRRAPDASLGDSTIVQWNSAGADGLHRVVAVAITAVGMLVAALGLPCGGVHTAAYAPETTH